MVILNDSRLYVDTFNGMILPQDVGLYHTESPGLIDHMRSNVVVSDDMEKRSVLRTEYQRKLHAELFGK